MIQVLHFYKICGVTALREIFEDPRNSNLYTCAHTLSMTGCYLKEIPYKLDEVSNRCALQSNFLYSFKNMPTKIKTLNVNNNDITSLIGINEHIKSCNTISLFANNITSGGLGLLLIEDLRGIFYNGIFDKNKNDKNFVDASNIITKYLGQGKRGLLSCQQELIDEGLEEFAVL